MNNPNCTFATVGLHTRSQAAEHALFRSLPSTYPDVPWSVERKFTSPSTPLERAAIKYAG